MKIALLLLAIGQCQGGRCPAPTQVRGQVPRAPLYLPGPTPIPIYVPGPVAAPTATPTAAPAPARPRDMTPINQARDAVLAAGYRLDDRMPPEPRFIAYYDYDTRAIRINNWHGFWNDRVRNAEIEHKVGHFSTPHFDHILRHEFGHAELHKVLGTAAMSALSRGTLPLPAARIREAVSGYATTSPIEFHAEVFAGLKFGRVFPPDVMTAYAAMTRPR